MQFPANVVLLPTTSLSASSLNATGQNASSCNYQTSMTEYVDKNANSIADSSTDYGKSLCEDRLVHLIDKLHIENGKGQMERQISSTHNRISVAAVAPALLLANHISPSILSNTEKSHNTNMKSEVCLYYIIISLSLLYYTILLYFIILYYFTILLYYCLYFVILIFVVMLIIIVVIIVITIIITVFVSFDVIAHLYAAFNRLFNNYGIVNFRSVFQSQELESSLVSSIDETVNESCPDGVVGLSTGSLTSSSSSGSETRMKTTSSILPLSAGTMNENCDMTMNDCPKPTVSSGAIPKSISFDMTAERGDKELLDDDQKNKRGFFGKLKMSLRNRRGKMVRGTDDIGRCYDREAMGDNIDIGRHRLRRIMSEDVTSTGNANGGKYLFPSTFCFAIIATELKRRIKTQTEWRNGLIL